MRLTDGEKAAIDATVERAKAGGNPPPEYRAAQAMDYAIRHCFYSNSVVEYRELLITAMEKAIGAARPEDLDREATRQGVLFEDGQVSPPPVSTQAVLDQEQRIFGDAAPGPGGSSRSRRGGMTGWMGCPMSRRRRCAMSGTRGCRDAHPRCARRGQDDHDAPGLGPAGRQRRAAGPSSDASRGKLREDGFHEANTVAAFLGESAEGKRMREKARGGIIWIDERACCRLTTWKRSAAWRRD